MTERGNILELRDVTTIFGSGITETYANRNVNLTLPTEPASIISIVGESGSGKTTVARTLLGLQQPTHGQALWRGKPINTLGKQERYEYRKEVQAVFQDPYGIFNPFYRINHVFDMILSRFKLASGKKEQQEIVEASLRAVGLRPGEVLGRYPHQLSGGERQRVMLARAHLMRPKVIIADEAISMLDVAIRATVMNILLDFRDNDGISTIFITHDLSAAHYLGGDIMVMRKGEVVETGDVDDVLHNPQHAYTQLLLTSLPNPDPDLRWQTDINQLAELERAAGVSDR
ncbi:MAG: ATP-binding cassette domain-containing protein [Thermomicrobiales bacterium]|nr:ATP-binding cassette domain-containing protein [Thermomicrobiales bacterium]MCO5217710.1 ATP-binding cassette domain-containing protein [Thermomicrobiales bacterium]MCO5226577.1 ATP-binding cassette domain-containing protein [Thermomicrobiales bacterium]MCO5228221.1 ATP-binding cassette domain-containing protein [Thermomicrobiales bacterium]